ncbi:MAG TPA: NAD(P)H-dependent glycerol-3-phosphate dehydrogenase [Oceanospirillaceae bacterium]|nr:NAD(P)H-dependent glycerol-3-phosphate dehydrogenase [Oceanospirillaceae bacterium]
MSSQHRVAVIGGGSFGTVLADIVAHNGYPVRLWMRDEALAQEIRDTRINSRYVPGLSLHADLEIVTDLAACISAADTVIFSVPSKAFRGILDLVKDFITPDQNLVTTAKGIEPERFLLMSQVLEVYFPNNPVGVISGPNLAKEVAAKQLTGTVIASDNEGLRETIQDVLQCSFFRVYASNDRYGTELGGALKNIYAIAAGLSAAMGMGENTRSMLLTRSLAEMSRLAVHMGANPMTFLGLAGVGDLIVTCMSPLSRNYRVGYALGQGKSLDDAVSELGEVAEGVNTLALVKAKSDQLEVHMPLVDGLYALVYEGADVSSVAQSLMARDQNSDVEFVLKRS